MTQLLQLVLANAVLAALAGGVVFLVTRVWRRPQVAHVLWLLVLVKFITPPLIAVPLPKGWGLDSWRSVALPSLAPASPPVAKSILPPTAFATSTDDAGAQSEPAAFRAADAQTGRTPAATARFSLSWPMLLVFVWGAGSLAIAVIGASRIIRFHRLVAATGPAHSQVLADACALAGEMGLRRVPPVRVVQGAIPPLVWGALGGPVILLPASLCDQLNRHERRTILAHELAHVLRNDHWVRWLEALVVTLFWWNPVVWLVCRELHVVEELCCDAWVVWLLPDSERIYAGAIVQTIDFLAGPAARLPAAASGIARTFPLKSRIRRILAGPAGHRLSPLLRLSLILAGTICLPLAAFPAAGEPASPAAADGTTSDAFLADAGKATADERAKEGAAAAATPEIDLDKVAEDELVGLVLDAHDKPLEGVTVDAWTWYPGNETRTDKQGRFRLKGLGRGQGIEVQFSKENYSPRLFMKQPTGSTDWVIVMDDKTWFEGQVTSNGKPVAKAQVRANRGPKQMDGGLITDLWTETYTGADGRYRLYVESDKYEIRVRVPGAGVARSNQKIGPDEGQNLDITLARGITFEAKVVDSLTGKPVPGIRLWNWQQLGIDGRSDAAGRVVITDMFPGKFDFNVEAKRFARWWSEQAASEWTRRQLDPARGGWQRNFDNLDFEMQENMPAVTITVEPEVTIRGRVLDPDGQPVAGATVAPALSGTGNSITGDTRYSVATDKEGRYEMQLPASGQREYNLIAHDGKPHEREWRKWANGIVEPFKTKPGETRDNFDLRLTRPAVVRGQVVDAQGNPVARREVRASSADNLENRYYVPTTETDENGRFELKFVRAGKQHIQVAPFWLQADEAPKKSTQLVDLKPGEVVDDIDLQADR